MSGDSEMLYPPKRQTLIYICQNPQKKKKSSVFLLNLLGLPREHSSFRDAHVLVLPRTFLKSAIDKTASTLLILNV